MRQADADFLLNDGEPVSTLAILDEVALQVASEFNVHVTIHVQHPGEIDPDDGDTLGEGTLTSYSPFARHKIITGVLDFCRGRVPENEISAYAEEISSLEEDMDGSPEKRLAAMREDAKAAGELSEMVDDMDQAALEEGLELADRLTKLLGLPLDPSNEDIIRAVTELQRAAKGN